MVSSWLVSWLVGLHDLVVQWLSGSVVRWLVGLWVVGSLGPVECF